VVERLMERGAIKRRRGRPRVRPARVAGDKAYSRKQRRRYLRKRGIKAVIPHQANERRGRFDQAAYRARHRVERLINRLKQYRRIATRYEKRAVNYAAMLTLGCILLWL
jgi:transposase